jgi:hypothetical protein
MWKNGRNKATTKQPPENTRSIKKTGFSRRERNLKSLRMARTPTVTAKLNQPNGPMANTALVSNGKGIANPEKIDSNFGMTRKNITPQRRYAPANIHEKAFIFMLI